MSSIVTPYGRLTPQSRGQMLGSVAAESEAAPVQDGYSGSAAPAAADLGPLPKAGNEIYAFDSITPKVDFTYLEEFKNNQVPWSDDPKQMAEVLAMARKADRMRAASISVRPRWVRYINADMKGSPLKISAVVGLPNIKAQPKGLVSTAKKVEEAAAAVYQGADEIESMGDMPALKKGDLTQFKNDVQAVVHASSGRPVKLILETGELSDDQIRAGCKAAEEAGATFISTSSGFGTKGKPGAEELVRDSCNLGIKSCTQNLTSCQHLAEQMGPKRKLRFAAFKPGKIAYQEVKVVREKALHSETALQAELRSPDGLKARAEVEAWRKKLDARIDQAHANGVPVVYLSVCIRPNDATSYEDNCRVHNQLVEQIRQAGLAYVDPFEMEGAELFKNPKLSPQLIQELLMDAQAGLWPHVLSKCDAITHGDYWKESVGAREEDLMAKAWGIPPWKGVGTVRLRSAAEQEESGPMQIEAHIAPARRSLNNNRHA